MNRPELFDWSVATLAQAFLEGKLQHTNCAACAVGNLIAAKRGYELKGSWNKWYKDDKNIRGGYWLAYILGHSMTPEQITQALNEVDGLEYTMEELVAIEHSFENRESAVRNMMQSATYEDLAKVYGTLCDIHEVEAVDRVNPEEIFITKEQNEQTRSIREVSECVSAGV